MSYAPKQTLIEGYNKFVIKNDNGCWGWSGCIPKSPGYGQFRHGMNLERSHRASWIIHNGRIKKGMFVLHKCDNRICSNPEHLFLGTQRDNIKDMVSKGRHAFARLTIKEKNKIKKMLNLNGKPYEIAAAFNISPSCIYYIKNKMIRSIK